MRFGVLKKNCEQDKHSWQPESIMQSVGQNAPHTGRFVRGVFRSPSLHPPSLIHLGPAIVSHYASGRSVSSVIVFASLAIPSRVLAFVPRIVY
jgi:hypothetical protein